MRYWILLFVVGISAGLYFLALSTTDWLFYPRGFNIFKYILRALLLLCSLFFFWKALLFVAHTSRKEFVKNIIAVFGALISLYIILELIFSFIPISTGGGKVLVTKNWFNYYWQENRLGYRDEDPINNDNPLQKDILVIGDSYVAGHGIENEDDRFSEILEKELNYCADVFNVAIPGADTYDEFIYLNNFPIKPELIVVAHVNNDLYSLTDKKKIFKKSSDNLNKFSYSSHIKKYKLSNSFLIANSFFLNFLDYVWMELQRQKDIVKIADGFDSFNDFLHSHAGRALEMTYYKDDSLLHSHLQRINLFIEYSKKNNIPLLFVLFPKMDDMVIDFTDQTANRPIAEYLKKRHVEAINLTPAIKKINEEKRRAGKFDPHPSKEVHRVVAKIIMNYIQSNGWLKKNCK